MTRTSEAGIALIKRFEGFSDRPYICPGGVLTVGYGSTRGVTANTVVDEAQADSMLRASLVDIESAISRMVTVPISQSQFDALACLAYNIGVGALRSSTLLRLLNAGDYPGAAEQFARWNKAAGKALPGLIARRAAERELFLSESA